MADHEASKIDKANHLLLDQPLLRLPYELLRKNFRSAHFIVEKESVAVKNGLKETATAGLNGKASTDDVLHSLDAMLNRMRAAKRKLEACAAEEADLYRQVDARLEHLSALSGMHSLDDVAYEAWSRRRFERLLVDYLLRHGYGASAAALVAHDDAQREGKEEEEEGEEDGSEKTAGKSGQRPRRIRVSNSEAGADTDSPHPSIASSSPSGPPLRDLVDMHTFGQMNQIRTRLLRDHSVAEALAWCADNKKELRKMESKLEFMLRYQQYIELVRSQTPARLLDAIHHARRYLFPMHDTFDDECKQAAALLCYPPDEGAPGQYGELWSPARWCMLADLFTTTHNQLLSLPAVPLLHLALSSGLSALKTPACHSHRHHDEDEHRDARTATAPENSGSLSASSGQLGQSVCPICSPELNELARHVPYAHHSKSHVENDLVLTPNGRVYGRGRLEAYASTSGLAAGLLKDLRTGEVFSEDELLKVYIT